MKALVNVLTQYYNENGRPKSGQTFQFRANSDIFLYDEEAAVQIIKKMIAEHDKEWAGHHEYISHEIVFFEPIQLDSNQFDKEYDAIVETRIANQ